MIKMSEKVSGRGALIILLSCLIWLASGVVSMEAQTLTLEPVGALEERADVVRVNGTFMYIAADQKLSVVDITDLSAPKVRSALTLPGTIYQIVLVGSVAYVANGLPGLAIVDVSNPTALKVLGSFKTPGEALRVAVTGTKAVVVNRASGLEVIDVSNPAKPVSLGSYYTDGYARDVAVSGSLAFVVDSTTDFAIVDLSKPGPTGVSRQELGDGTENVVVTPTDSAQGVHTAYVMGSGMLQVFDVSKPSAPTKVTTFNIPGRFPICGAPPCAALEIQRSLAYVAGGSEGVQIVDLSNREKPTLAGFYKTAGPARDVAVAGSLIFVAVAEPRQAADSNTKGPPHVLILRQSP